MTIPKQIKGYCRFCEKETTFSHIDPELFPRGKGTDRQYECSECQCTDILQEINEDGKGIFLP